MRPPREDTLPWYKQFWPWFLISLPLSVVIASIVTINLAIRTNDGLVSDDYYKEGLAIHMDADRSARAEALGIRGNVRYQSDTGAITLTLDQPLPQKTPALSLEVNHPTRPDQDQSIQLTTLDERRYAGRLQTLGPAHWKLELGDTARSWRVEGRMAVPASNAARLD